MPLTHPRPRKPSVPCRVHLHRSSFDLKELSIKKYGSRIHESKPSRARGRGVSPFYLSRARCRAIRPVEDLPSFEAPSKSATRPGIVPYSRVLPISRLLHLQTLLDGLQVKARGRENLRSGIGPDVACRILSDSCVPSTGEPQVYGLPRQPANLARRAITPVR